MGWNFWSAKLKRCLDCGVACIELRVVGFRESPPMSGWLSASGLSMHHVSNSSSILSLVSLKKTPWLAKSAVGAIVALVFPGSLF